MFLQTQKVALRKQRDFKVKVEDGTGPGWAVSFTGAGQMREDTGCFAGSGSPGKMDLESGALLATPWGLHGNSADRPGD